jgi:hypothetical protein
VSCESSEQSIITNKFTHIATVTGNACVEGYNMIRVDFVGSSTYNRDSGNRIYVPGASVGVKASCEE